jgi:hypothetical protein
MFHLTKKLGIFGKINQRRPDYSRIKKDNFWEMGVKVRVVHAQKFMSICVPMQKKISSFWKSLVNDDHPQVVEIWNSNAGISTEKADEV